ncbi:tetratricopeptide repeat protein (macronuclear) [Tetrahymena thermophila SB210]|uniref:Tetratricopeptide repeat protein n=1 Tax=Tetrahymena thermophila (strain SB210) TaxID=312017 RepID=I7MJ37_TETTS|nr:tetratricopeptide repeat protein [Tetrahymena thermophila SB210]EAR95776.3 tetratricopeptide repeat protein [Tetrahymena thermophila SB210]|eukprot:XP_001016021.3 tetratricopeptide repeat protein [Tetrahymena thermophila SB210]
MKINFICQLILLTSSSIIFGVVLILYLFYDNLFNSLLQWETESRAWITATEQQRLHNSVYSNKIISEQNTNKLYSQMYYMKQLIKKFKAKKYQKNQKSNFLICSYYEYNHNLCGEQVYKQQKTNELYVDLYFERNRKQYKQLDTQQKEFYDMNLDFSFLPNAIYNDAKRNSLFSVSFIYNADDTSLMAGSPSLIDNFSDAEYQTCKGNNYPEPYDPRCRPWYIYSLQHLGYNFYKPYVDATNFKVIMTVSSQVQDQQGKFISILSIDFGIDNLINSVFAQQDQTNQQAFDQYNVLLHEDQTTVFYHKFYDNNSGVLKSWGDIEFSGLFNYTNDEKISFQKQVNDSIQFMKSGNYSIQEYQNVLPLFQYWTRNGQKYVSLIYPIIMNNNLSLVPKQERGTFAFSILIVAKVSKDYRDQLQLFKVFDNNQLIIPFITEAVLLALFIIIFLSHYGVIQIRQVYIPLKLLIQFLKKTLNQQLLSACYQRNNKQDSNYQQEQHTTPKDKNNLNIAYKQSILQTKNMARSVLQYIDSPQKMRKQNNFQMDQPHKKVKLKQAYPLKNNSINQQAKEIMSITERAESNFNINNNIFDALKFNQTQILTTNHDEETFKSNKQQFNQIRRNLIQQVYEIPCTEEQKRIETSALPSPTNNNCMSNRIVQEIQDSNTYQGFQNLIQQQEIHLRSEKKKLTGVILSNQSEFRINSQRELTYLNQLRSSYNDKKQSQYKIYESKESPNIKNSPFRDTKSETYSLYRKKEQSIQYTQGSAEKQEDMEQNIGQIDPMFKEMDIIKETFEQLEQVINYAISSSHSHSSFIQNLLHFANAKSTFQKISNISGLNRCYFNLGILNILNGNYEQSIEQLNASIITSLQGNCIYSLEDFALCLEKGLINYTDDQLFIFSKKLFALSYAHKQILLTTLIDQNLFKQTKTNDEKALANKSLKYLELIAKIIWLRPNIFQILFRLVIIVEFVEFNLLLDHVQIAESYLDEFDYIIHNQSQSQQLFTIIKQAQRKSLSQKSLQSFTREKRATLEQIYLNLQLQNEDSETLITQITIKSLFLRGQISFYQKKFKDAGEYFTLCIEEGKTYESEIRHSSLLFLKQILEAQSLYSLELDYMLSQINQMKLSYDIIIIFDNSYTNSFYIKNQITQIKNLIEMGYFKQEDKIMILSYGEQLNNIQHFEQIRSARQWDIIFHQILQKNASCLEYKLDDLRPYQGFKFNEDNSKILLSEALILGFVHSQEINQITANQYQSNILQKNRRKQIISFSIQAYDQSMSFYDQIFSQQQKDFIESNIKIKPDVYHLNLQIDGSFEDYFEQPTPTTVSQSYQNFYLYQTENQFVQSLFKCRDQQKSSFHSLFLSFISNQE